MPTEFAQLSKTSTLSTKTGDQGRIGLYCATGRQCGRFVYPSAFAFGGATPVIDRFSAVPESRLPESDGSWLMTGLTLFALATHFQVPF
jgi:hypothetical protein